MLQQCGIWLFCAYWAAMKDESLVKHIQSGGSVILESGRQVFNVSDLPDIDVPAGHGAPATGDQGDWHVVFIHSSDAIALMADGNVPPAFKAVAKEEEGGEYEPVSTFNAPAVRMIAETLGVPIQDSKAKNVAAITEFLVAQHATSTAPATGDQGGENS
jgi:hypothetical protein